MPSIDYAALKSFVEDYRPGVNWDDGAMEMFKAIFDLGVEEGEMIAENRKREAPPVMDEAGQADIGHLDMDYGLFD